MRQASPVGSVALLFVAATVMGGCLGVDQAAVSDELNSYTATVTADDDVLKSAQPDFVAPVAEALPSAAQTLYTTGVMWVGVNAFTVQNGDLGAYDGGEGMAVGVAFGNENVKQFYEFSYEQSQGHQVYLTGQTDPAGDGTHRRFYLGIRRYLYPVTGEAGRMVPFVLGGMAYHTFQNDGEGDAAPITTPIVNIGKASGIGAYIGTGIELYLTDQLTLGLDSRLSYWNWEGLPEATGENGTASASIAVYYHF